ncbi:unnamed protein product [Sphenostylis stenocarpa]|uniref:Uncharacterized protein n=1 Tax=Sphenostylis stenocarpa TaxID=92480 RepID=A0AA86T1S3_9FABA|nr:unnamed protein product [Sphenostylis stenocarpa]
MVVEQQPAKAITIRETSTPVRMEDIGSGSKRTESDVCPRCKQKTTIKPKSGAITSHLVLAEGLPSEESLLRMFPSLPEMDCIDTIQALHNLLPTTNSLVSHAEKKALESKARSKEKKDKWWNPRKSKHYKNWMTT